MKKKTEENPEALRAIKKIETKEYEPWEIQGLLKTICESGKFSLIRRAILLLELDGYNPLNR
jgi:hypothetical protein